MSPLDLKMHPEANIYYSVYFEGKIYLRSLHSICKFSDFSHLPRLEQWWLWNLRDHLDQENLPDMSLEDWAH